MKKRLLSALLALALVFVLLPTTALAGEVNGRGDISIAGKDWNFTKNTSGYETVYYQVQSKSGVFSTSLENKTGCVYPTNPYLEITRKGNTITVIVHGAVTITTNKGTNNAAEECIEVNKSDNQTTTLNLVITGVEGTKNNTLTLECKGYGSALSSYQGDITITGGVTVNANSTYSNSNTGVSARAINVFNGDLTISGTGTTVNAENRDSHHPTIDVKNAVTISDGATLTAKNTSGDKAISFGSITADGYDFKYWTTSGYTTLTGEDKATNIQTYSRIKLTPTVIEKDSYVYIAGGPAVVGVRTSLGEGNGYYTYNKDTKTFTLENVNITSVINAIQLMADGTYTINLVGTNTISDVSAGIVASNLYGANDITAVLSGTGSLDITAGHYAIDMQKVGNLKFENTGTIKLTTGYKYPASTCNALYVVGNVTIDTTKYGITGQKQAQGFPTEDIGNSPVFETILKGTDSTLYFKTITIAPKPSKTYYNGTAMKYGETKTVGNGTISCDENGVITLNGVTEGTLEFRSSADSTLVLEGTSTLSSIVTTQMGLTISGSGSLTVGSIRVPNNTTTSNSPSLTIDGAKVTAGTPTSTTRAVEVKGDLTVTNGSLTATSKSDSVPTVQVGGNASFTGSTVTITNKSTTQGEQYKDSNAASSALHVNGAVTISGGTVMAEATAGGNAIRAVGNITVSNDATVTAKNNSQYFNAITAGEATGGEVNTLYNLIVSGENTRITATNTHDNKLAYGGAINAYIKNANEGHYLQVGTDTKAIAPNVNTTVKNNSLTITRGDAYTTPQVAANYTIAGQTMYVGKYYKTDARGNITEGTAQDYNIFCDSENDFTLNNATISSTGTSGSTGVIKTNLNYSSAQFHIKLIGTNSINNAGHHAILGEGAYSTIIIENAENASNASLTISGNFLPVYSFGNVTINAEVVIINTNGNLISTNKGGHANGAFDLGSGYKCYASTDASGSPLETYDAAKSSTYKYLCVTKENLAPTTPTPQTPFTIDGIPAQFVDGGMIATTGVTATSSNNINLPIDRVKWYTFTPVFGSDGRMDSVSDKTEATGNFEAGKYYVVEIKFVQDLSPFKSWDMKVSGWSDNDVYRQSVTARNDIEIYFLTPASAATHEHNWAENYDTVYHWKMCTYDGCTAIKDKALHVWNAWHTSNNEQQHSKSCSECSYSTPPHDIDLAYVSDGEQGHHLYCKHDGCTFVTGTTAHNYEEGSNICTDCGYNKSAPCDHGDRAYTNNGDGTHKVTCNACGATIVEKQSHEFGPTGACIYCGATQSGGDPTPDNPGTIVIIRPAEEEKPAQQPNPSTGANDLVGLAVAAAVAAALGSAALLRKHD